MGRDRGARRLTAAARASAVLTVLVGLAACASTAAPPTHPGSGDAPSVLVVSCSPDGVEVSAEAVKASADGVRLQVSSTAPAGTYLTFEWSGGGGGEALPSAATTWTRTVPPGELTLACMTGDDPGEGAVVTVTDPNGYWSTVTLDDLGCAPGGSPSWAVGAAWGPTAEAAVANLVTTFVEDGVEGFQGAPPQALRASVGYSGSAEGVWLVSAEDGPYLSARVTRDAGGFTAQPDLLCG